MSKPSLWSLFLDLIDGTEVVTTDAFNRAMGHGLVRQNHQAAFPLELLRDVITVAEQEFLREEGVDAARLEPDVDPGADQRDVANAAFDIGERVRLVLDNPEIVVVFPADGPVSESRQPDEYDRKKKENQSDSSHDSSHGASYFRVR
jgi:hypothetical protein